MLGSNSFEIASKFVDILFTGLMEEAKIIKQEVIQINKLGENARCEDL